MRVEVLIPTELSPTGDLMLRSMCDAIDRTDDDRAFKTGVYRGTCDVLMLYGVGAVAQNAARNKHIASGRRVVVWDLGYFAREKITGHLRCSIDHDHPQRYLNEAPDDPSRWDKLGIPLREDYDKDGHILLIGLGSKSRSYLNEQRWEQTKLADLRRRFPKRRIIYRPKPGHVSPHLAIETAPTTKTIEELLKHCSLVACRHSNVACDAILAGVPFEAEDGAAVWLKGKPFTPENRLHFLRKLAWWQWRAVEAQDAWRFLSMTLLGIAA